MSEENDGMSTDCKFCGRLNLYLHAKVRERERERGNTDPTENRINDLVDQEFVIIVRRLADYPWPTAKGKR